MLVTLIRMTNDVYCTDIDIDLILILILVKHKLCDFPITVTVGQISTVISSKLAVIQTTSLSFSLKNDYVDLLIFRDLDLVLVLVSLSLFLFVLMLF